MPTIERATIDRRFVSDRRVAYNLDYFQNGGIEIRNGKERRSQKERRCGWVRVSMRKSVNIQGLKIGELSE